MTTFFDIIYKIKAALEADPRVNTVSYGTIDLQALEKHNTYSLSHFNITNTSFTSNMIEISINILCMDILSIEKGVDFSDFERKDNTYDVLNTQHSILNRLFSMFERGEFVDDGFKLSGSPVSSPFMVRFNDHVAGWESDFTIQVPNNMSICGTETFNTFIGNGYVNYQTKQAIASAIGIDDTEISDFTKEGNSIKFNIANPYAMRSSAFLNDRDITSYMDYDDLCSSLGSSAFNGARALEEVRLYGVTNLSTQCLRFTHLKSANFPLAVTSGQFFLRDCYILERVNIPLLTPVGGDPLDNRAFDAAKPGLAVRTNIANQTNNGGSPDGDLEYVVNTLGGSVTYV